MSKLNELVAASTAVSAEKDRCVAKRQQQEASDFTSRKGKEYKLLLRQLRDQQGGKALAKEALVQYRQNREMANNDFSIGSIDSLVEEVSAAYDEMRRAEQVKKSSWSRLTDNEEDI